MAKNRRFSYLLLTLGEAFEAKSRTEKPTCNLCPFGSFVFILRSLPRGGATLNSEYNYTRFLTSLKGCFVPDARLHLADVGRAHHKHTES